MTASEIQIKILDKTGIKTSVFFIKKGSMYSKERKKNEKRKHSNFLLI